MSDDDRPGTGRHRARGPVATSGTGPGDGAGGGPDGGPDGPVHMSPRPATAIPAGVVVDPRMRLRRIAVRRHAGRRRLRTFVLVVALAALVAGVVGLTRSPVLDVDRVLVTGAAHTDPGDVVAASGVGRGDRMVGVDAGAVRARVGALPWVDEVRVRRSWPSTVRIEVTERTVVATVQVGADRAALVDAGGRVLAVEARAGDAPPVGDLPVLTGVSGRLDAGGMLPAAARDALSVSRAVAERMPGAVAAVSTDLDASLVAGGEIRFGSVEHLDEKVTAAKTVLAEVDLTCLETLDVRVPGSPALTRNQRCS
ncbi:MAG TPA: FtsQ-type POTRA domain-containing protein [Acidimicrobiales bacterium]|nr:FtsQ-type POTRA domain-containing protein [Acidimicrobiales bacterium]